jgi:hypothetical protein
MLKETFLSWISLLKKKSESPVESFPKNEEALPARYWIQFKGESREEAMRIHPEGYEDVGDAVSDAIVGGVFRIIDRNGNEVFDCPTNPLVEVE